MARLLGCAAVQFGEGHEALGQAADDRERHRQAERPGAERRLGRAADGDPDRERILERAGIDAAVVDRGAVTAGPADALGVAQREEQSQLLLEEIVVVAQVVAEERERLDERPATGHDLGPPAGEQVERAEVLEDAHRIVGAEDGDGAREPDRLRASGGGGQHDRRRRHREVGTMVLADAEDVEPDLVGELDLLEQVAQTLLWADLVRGQLREGVDAELHAAKVADACSLNLLRWAGELRFRSGVAPNEQDRRDGEGEGRVSAEDGEPDPG